MAANTYIPIASVTVGAGGAATMAFTSIPSTYTDLVLKTSVRTNTTGSGSALRISFNGSSSSFTRVVVYGSGIGTGSNTDPAGDIGLVNGTTETANTFASTDTYIPNYLSSNYKSMSSDSTPENNATVDYIALVGTLWSNTSTISSITLTPQSGSFVQYSTAYLYGVSNA